MTKTRKSSHTSAIRSRRPRPASLVTSLGSSGSSSGKTPTSTWKSAKLVEKLRVTTPEEKYREYVEYHEHFDEDGDPISTYNPDSKWDWYVIGGRWDGWINDRETSSEAVSDNIATTEAVLERNRIPHAIITPDGQWHEQGQMGWFGIMLTENDDYQSEARLLLGQFPGHHIITLDAHI